jgi:hypothetical protein
VNRICSDFNAIWAYVISWVDLRDSRNNGKQVQFDLIITTDGTHSFAIFNYRKLDSVDFISGYNLSNNEFIHEILGN